MANFFTSRLAFTTKNTSKARSKTEAEKSTMTRDLLEVSFTGVVVVAAASPVAGAAPAAAVASPAEVFLLQLMLEITSTYPSQGTTLWEN